MNRRFTGVFLPSSDREIYVERIQFDRIGNSAYPFSGV